MYKFHMNYLQYRCRDPKVRFSYGLKPVGKSIFSIILYKFFSIKFVINKIPCECMCVCVCASKRLTKILCLAWNGPWKLPGHHTPHPHPLFRCFLSVFDLNIVWLITQQLPKPNFFPLQISLSEFIVRFTI